MRLLEAMPTLLNGGARGRPPGTESKTAQSKMPSIVGRGSGIRTRDPLLPKQVLYQAELCPDTFDFKHLGHPCPLIPKLRQGAYSENRPLSVLKPTWRQPMHAALMQPRGVAAADVLCLGPRYIGREI